MNKKQQSFETKLGSWTDLATPGYNQQPAEDTVIPSSITDKSSSQPLRERYRINRSLMDRIVTTAVSHDLSPNEVIGHLLTWALDQVDAGEHQLPAPFPTEPSSASPSENASTQQ